MRASSDRGTSHAEFHVSFVYAALAIALTVGFGYAAVLAFLIGFDLPLGDWLVSAIQAHGHAQLYGWTGLFIVGVSLHFVPRMTGAPLRYPQLLPWICGLLSGGVGLRAVAQPLLDVYAGGAVRLALRWGMGLGALVEAAGVGLYLLLFITTMRRSGTDRQAIRPVRPFLITALAGWGLSTLLVTCLSLSAALDDRSVLDLAWNRLAAELYLGLVLLPVGMAFSVRTFPLYLRLPAPRWPVRLVAGLYLCGFALEKLPELLGLLSLLPPDGGIRIPLSGAGRGIKGAALIWFVWELDILLRRKAPWTVERVGEPEPDRRKTREGLPDYGEFGRFERLLYAAYVWLFVAAGLDAGSGVTMMLKGALPVHADAVRHAYLAGFVSLLIFGMAPRMIPGFVHRRRLAFPGLVNGTFYLANGAVLCRVLPLLLPGDLIGHFPLLAQGSTYAFGLSGIFGWTATAALAWNLTASVGWGIKEAKGGAMSEPRALVRVDRPAEWRARLAILVSGLLVFETLTGLAIYLLPFSLLNQFATLVHTAAGLVFVIPYAWYQVRHWFLYRRAAMTHVKLTGYLSLATTAVCGVSGVGLTWQAIFSRHISYAWDTAHIISTFALVAFALPHVLALVLRDRKRSRVQGLPLDTGPPLDTRSATATRGRRQSIPSVPSSERSERIEGGIDDPGPVTLDSRLSMVAAERQFGWGVLGVTVVLFAGVGLWAYAYEPVRFRNAFPPDYSFKYGANRPFAPSLAKTATGGALDARSLSDSRSCGTSGCHEEIVREWEPSAHRYAALDAAFQAVQNVMGKQNGPESTRYCGGCHDPISLFSGTKNIFAEDLTALTGYQEGVSCIVCHAIKETDVQGNANYTLAQPKRYAYELKEGEAARFLRDFLIRAYPRHHVESLSHRLFKSPEFCAACHKQFVDREVNNVGWVQLQNQYDNWRKSRWNHPGDARKTVECRECHMPLVGNSQEPASGDALDYNRSAGDGRHRSHRFLGANQFIPVVQKLPGGEQQAALVEKWLRGEVEIPEIAHKWTQGRAVPIELIAPERVAPGAPVDLKVVITSNKVGHDFPTGPLDIIQSWVELIVKDDGGNVVYRSGTLDDRHFIEPGSFIFKAEPVDQYGNLIDRHNLWEMVEVRFRRSLFPGFSDVAEYSFSCPAAFRADGRARPSEEKFVFQAPPGRRGTLHAQARLQYRKIDQFLLNFLMGEKSGLTTPVTTISQDTKTIQVGG